MVRHERVLVCKPVRATDLRCLIEAHDEEPLHFIEPPALKLEDMASYPDARAQLTADAGLLPQLAPRRLFEGLVRLQPTARRDPQRPVAQVNAKQEKPVRWIEQQDARSRPIPRILLWVIRPFYDPAFTHISPDFNPSPTSIQHPTSNIARLRPRSLGADLAPRYCRLEMLRQLQATPFRERLWGNDS